MQACRNHNETLMLDVLNELTDPLVRRDWEGHLASCSGCRTERARMLHLLGQVRASGSPPELSDAAAQRMASAVREIQARLVVPARPGSGRGLRIDHHGDGGLLVSGLLLWGREGCRPCLGTTAGGSGSGCGQTP